MHELSFECIFTSYTFIFLFFFPFFLTSPRQGFFYSFFLKKLICKPGYGKNEMLIPVSEMKNIDGWNDHERKNRQRILARLLRPADKARRAAIRCTGCTFASVRTFQNGYLHCHVMFILLRAELPGRCGTK